MTKLEQYIIKNLSMLFMSIFLSLFSIASVIFLIKLATYTAVIQLTTWDMLKLYIFVIPELLFFTLPISFFVASALTINKLSNENEIIVLFALGIHPKFIVKTLAKPALLLSTLLLFNFFVVLPHVKVLSKNFITFKKTEAKFNLSASEYGHKFGDWLLYLGEKNSDSSYSEVFLFNKNDTQEVLIEAEKAYITNDEGILRLQLVDGEAYVYSKEKFSQTNFETMYINNTNTTEYLPHLPTLEYWTKYDHGKKAKVFSVNAILSLFPILSLFFILSISVIHARHQKSKIYFYLFSGLIVYYGLTLWLTGLIPNGIDTPSRELYKIYVLSIIPVVTIPWLISTYFLYRKTIVARF